VNELVVPPTVVLIVEDEPLIMLATSLMITDFGYRVLEAENAAHAISILELHPEITIVVTDIQMAGAMDGLDLARYAARRWPPLYFIIVSGGLTPSIEQMPAGAMFLAKPYGSRAIDRLIRGFA
jgi:CheY-like chemotaxis protein